MLVLKRLNLHHPDQNQIIKINPNNNYVYFGRLPYKYFLKTADQKKMPGLPNCQFIQVDHVDVSRIHVRLEIIRIQIQKMIQTSIQATRPSKNRQPTI